MISQESIFAFYMQVLLACFTTCLSESIHVITLEAEFSSHNDSNYPIFPSTKFYSLEIAEELK